MTLHEILLAKAFGGGGSGGAVDLTGCTPSKGLKLSEVKSFAIVSEDATSIENLAFFDCTSLTSVDLPVAESIGVNSFNGCTSLASVDLPKVTSIGECAFLGCTSLASVDLPSATSIGVNSFNGCTSLASVDLPKVTSIDVNSFADCTSLTSVDLPSATSIGGGAFWECTNLKTFIIRNEAAVCQVMVTALVNTGIVTAEGAPTGEGFIYVPTKFYEDYVTMIATQAAYMLVSQGMAEAEAQATADYIARAIFRKIEDYPEICG